MWISVISNIALFICVAYLLVMAIITLGWYRLAVAKDFGEKAQIPLAVVLAARNEETTIGRLLNGMASQNYPSSLFEVVVVNDQSTDNTAEVVETFIANHPHLNIKLLLSIGAGKKLAIQQGISSVNSEYIVTTDADCVVHPDWLQTISNKLNVKGVSMVLAPVVYEYKTGILPKIFTLEFMSLVASGAGAVGMGLPFMGNAANMAFSRKVFQSAIKERAYQQYTSGDDVFLIGHVVRHFRGKSVQFILDENALVQTPPPSTLSEFVNQRLRWASKAKGYTLPMAVVVSLVVLMANSLLLSLIIGGFWLTMLWPIFLLLLVTKIMVDMPLVISFARFVNRSDLLYWFIPFSVVYPIYISIVGLASLFVGFTWKNRKYTN